MNHSFLSMYRGMLEGVLSDRGYIDLVNSVRGEWYGLEYRTLVSSGPAQMIPLLKEGEIRNTMITLLEEVRGRKLTTVNFPFAYATDLRKPALIKIYDPSRCGSSCSTKTPDPWWIFSQLPPSHEELKELLPLKGKGWFGVFG